MPSVMTPRIPPPSSARRHLGRRDSYRLRRSPQTLGSFMTPSLSLALDLEERHDSPEGRRRQEKDRRKNQSVRALWSSHAGDSADRWEPLYIVGVTARNFRVK